MLIFNLTIHHLWGRVLVKFQEARAIAYADDGYIKAKLSIALQVLAELKTVSKADAGLELNVSKTSILPKVSPPRLHLIWRGPSCKQPPPSRISPTKFSLIPSDLKVSLALACQLALMPLYGVLWLKHAGTS